MKFNQLALSMLLSLSLSAGAGVLAKSHHKKADATPPASSADANVDVSSKRTSDRSLTSLGDVGGAPASHTKKHRKHQVAAVPDAPNVDNRTPNKEHGGFMGLFHRPPSADRSTDRGADRTSDRTANGVADQTSNRAGADRTSNRTSSVHPSWSRNSKVTPTETATDSSRMPDMANHEGQVFVHGYTKKDGTKVDGYWRNKPHHRG